MEEMARRDRRNRGFQKRNCRQTSIGPAPDSITTSTCRCRYTRPCSSVSRVVGWSAHVIEQHDNNRLIRPRAKYTGETGLKYVPVGGAVVAPVSQHGKKTMRRQFSIRTLLFGFVIIGLILVAVRGCINSFVRPFDLVHVDINSDIPDVLFCEIVAESDGQARLLPRYANKVALLPAVRCRPTQVRQLNYYRLEAGRFGVS